VHLECAAGDYVYIPADVGHQMMNRSGADATALIGHTARLDLGAAG
jgi:uncharacterized RmlC-like cupin family protein